MQNLGQTRRWPLFCFGSGTAHNYGPLCTDQAANNEKHKIKYAEILSNLKLLDISWYNLLREHFSQSQCTYKAAGRHPGWFIVMSGADPVQPWRYLDCVLGVWRVFPENKLLSNVRSY